MLVVLVKQKIRLVCYSLYWQIDIGLSLDNFPSLQINWLIMCFDISEVLKQFNWLIFL